MGRTSPTYRDALGALESEWAPFRRGLRRRYQEDFDRLFDRARDHADAAGYANGTDPEFAFLLSVALAHEVELRRLREQVEALEDGPDVLEGGPDTLEDGPDAPASDG
jgi:hypothetical protein